MTPVDIVPYGYAVFALINGIRLLNFYITLPYLKPYSKWSEGFRLSNGLFAKISRHPLLDTTDKLMDLL